MKTIIIPHRDFAITDNSKATAELRGWMESITKAVEDLKIIDGQGSPEGVLTASQKTKYFDSVGATLYFKTTEVGNTGWIAL